MTDFGISAVMNLAYDKNLQEEEESQGERGRTEERPVVWYLVLYSQGRVAHHKQDIFSMYDTVYKTYIFFVHRPARVSWSVTLYINLPRSAGVWTLLFISEKCP